MGCDLAYVLVPKASLEQMVQDQAKKRMSALSKNLFRNTAIELQAPDDEAREQFLSEFAVELLKGGKELWN